jgi:hypothetical protein
MQPSVLFFLETCVAVTMLLAAGYSLSSAIALVVKRITRKGIALSVAERLSAGYLLVVFLVSLPVFFFRAGVSGLSAFPSALSYVLTALGAAGGIIFLRDARRRISSGPVKLSDAMLLTFGVALFLFISYLFAVQSVDTNYDFYFRNFKVILWPLHDGSYSNPLLQYTYDLTAFPAYWLYVSLDAALGAGVTMFSLSLTGLASLSLVVYHLARETLTEEVARAGAILVLVSPLSLLYSFRSLDFDFTTYYLILASFCFLYLALRREGRPERPFWLLMAGLGASGAMLSDPKGFAVAFLLPSLLAYYSKSKVLKLVWAAAFFGILGYSILGPAASYVVSGIGYALALLLPIALLASILYFLTASKSPPSIRFVLTPVGTPPSGAQPHLFGLPRRDYLLVGLAVAPGLLWHAFFGYFRLFLMGVNPRSLFTGGLSLPAIRSYQLQALGSASRLLPGALSALTTLQVPSGVVTYVGRVVQDLPNSIFSFLGLFTFPYLAAPVCALGVVGLLYAFVRRKEEVTPLLIYALAVIATVLVFSQGSVASDNWRYGYLLLPFTAIAAAYGLSLVVDRRVLVPVAVLFSSFYLFTLPLTAVEFNGATLWFSNAVRGVSAYADYSLWWVAGAWILVGLCYFFRSRYSSSLLASTRGPRLRRVSMAVVLLLSIALVAQPFAPLISSTALQDISAVRQDKGYGWNGGPQAPFEYISQNRAEFGGSAFLTLFANGIEYYAGVPSIDLSQRYEYISLEPYFGDAASLRSFLLSHGISYALFPSTSNPFAGFGTAAASWERTTAVGALLNESTLMENWGTWELYNLTTP